MNFNSTVEGAGGSGSRRLVVAADACASPEELFAHLKAGREIVGHPELCDASFAAGPAPNPRRPGEYIAGLSAETSQHASDLRRIGATVYSFEFPRMGRDDRFADNANLIFDGYELKHPAGLVFPSRKHLFLHVYENQLSKPVQEFLIRTPEPYFRLLYSRLGVNTIEKLEHAVAALSDNTRLHQGSTQNATDFLAETSVVLLETLLINVRTATIDEFVKHARSEWFTDLRNSVHSKSSHLVSNIAVLNDLGKFASEQEFLRTFRNRVFLENLRGGDLRALAAIIGSCENDPVQLRRKLLEIAASYDVSGMAQEFSDISGALKGRKIPETYGAFILETLRGGEYLHQNVFAIRELERHKVVQTAEHVEKLRVLQKRFNGFITPALARRYLETANPDQERMLFEQYAELRRQVLSSQPISSGDPDLIAEVVMQAYRPVGYSIAQVAQQIQNGSVHDNSSHLERITYKAEGYLMKVALAQRSVSGGFDVAGLAAIDGGLNEELPPSALSKAVQHALNNTPERDTARRSLLLAALVATGDARVSSYVQEQLLKSGTGSYDEQRLAQLQQLLQVNPAEDLFESGVRKVLESDGNAHRQALEAAERSMWFARKGKASPEERQCKNRIDQILKELRTDSGSDVGALLAGPELAILDGAERAALSKVRGEKLKGELHALKCRRFLGCEAEQLEERATALFIAALRDTARVDGLFVRHELEKVSLTKTNETAELRAVISKNVGSFYAKAGVAICTAGNTEMWNEDRHFHLNIVRGEQIVGNVMVYLDKASPHDDYLVARGFNPRDDALWSFDHQSLAEELTRVLTEIAAANRRREIFITGQTGWHELGNRDMFAQVILKIAERNMAKVRREEPNQRTVINNARFAVTQDNEFGHRSDKLLLLALVPAAS